jgi:hypothetical protein
MPGNTTDEGPRSRTSGVVARPRPADTTPGRAAHPDAAEATYLEDVGRRGGRDGEAAAAGTPAAGWRCGGG